MSTKFASVRPANVTPVAAVASIPGGDLPVTEGAVSSSDAASAELLRSLLRITQALTTELEPDKAYGAILGVVKQVTGADRVSLQLVPRGEDEATLELAAGLGLPPGAMIGSRAPLKDSVAAWVLKARQPLLLNGASHPEPEVQRLMRRVSGQSAICVPLVAKGNVLGVLSASKFDAASPFVDQDLDFVAVLAGQAAIAIEHSRLYDQMVQLAMVDGLTGLLNHASFQSRLAAELERSGRMHQEVGLLMLDLDGFKQVNDTYGHPTGDRLLKLVADRAILASIRPYDIASRPGGDEFAIILPHASAEQAMVVAERVRAAVVSCDTSVIGVPAGMVRSSVGVAHFPTDAVRREDLVEVADNALYLAKYLGRNRVERGSSAVAHFERDPDKLEQLLADANTSTIEALAAAIDARDSFTAGHSKRVAEFAEALARALGYDDRWCHDLRLACLFHDVGKIGVPDAIMRKSGKLTDEEFAQMQLHPKIGAQMLQHVAPLMNSIGGIRHHHERWDGKGYPDGLVGAQIPEAARIISIVDAYDAMTSNRLYRTAMIHEDVLRILRSGAGIQWDEEMIATWIQVLSDQP
jgi:diguanylate cyclase (GGDEF)-like protein